MLNVVKNQKSITRTRPQATIYGLRVTDCVKWLKKRSCIIEALLATFFLIIVSSYFFLIAPPHKFPIGKLITIEKGMTVSEIADRLKVENVIRSRIFFKAAILFLDRERNVIAGDYFFSKSRTAFSVARMVSEGEFGLTPTRVTFKEGVTVSEIAEIVSPKFGYLRVDEFIAAARELEGYLFPDTYFFLPNIRAEGVIAAMEENFYKNIKSLEHEISASSYTLHEILTMASMLEKEASDFETRRMIAGILWNRLSIDMPLQVDATFLYINGKNTYELTLEDLRENESPYNTYKHKGLPPGPIGNPGLESVQAAIDPMESDYLYYLSDRLGNTYYARTFNEHKINKNKYVY